MLTWESDIEEDTAISLDSDHTTFINPGNALAGHVDKELFSIVREHVLLASLSIVDLDAVFIPVGVFRSGGGVTATDVDL